MLILRYQRLYLLDLFKVELVQPLLAFQASKILSKPNTPPYIYYYNIIFPYFQDMTENYFTFS